MSPPRTRESTARTAARTDAASWPASPVARTIRCLTRCVDCAAGTYVSSRTSLRPRYRTSSTTPTTVCQTRSVRRVPAAGTTCRTAAGQSGRGRASSVARSAGSRPRRRESVRVGREKAAAGDDTDAHRLEVAWRHRLQVVMRVQPPCPGIVGHLSRKQRLVVEADRAAERPEIDGADGRRRRAGRRRAPRCPRRRDSSDRDRRRRRARPRRPAGDRGRSRGQSGRGRAPFARTAPSRPASVSASATCDVTTSRCANRPRGMPVVAGPCASTDSASSRPTTMAGQRPQTSTVRNATAPAKARTRTSSRLTVSSRGTSAGARSSRPRTDARLTATAPPRPPP